jgi:alcohol dehydrogenase class IV
MNGFGFHTTPFIVCRVGAGSAIAGVIGKRLGDRILFVTDPGLVNLGLAGRAVDNLRGAGFCVTVFASVEADPSRATLEKAVEAGSSARVTGVIGFGGGSSLDVAKLAALLLGSNESLDAAWGVGVAKGPRLPLVLVPTTAGTGSEVTPVSIITVGADEKRGVSSPIILPDIAILDADLTIGLPPAITAATGVDAMVHAIEAFASKNANNNPLSAILAREALRLLGRHIRTAVFNGTDLAARSGMLLGSMLAGQAFANSPVAAVHALAYPISGMFHVPHGLSNALVLPHVLRFNAPEAAPLYADIAHEVFPALSLVGDLQERCAAFIEQLASLSLELGMNTRLREVGIDEEHLPRLASEAMKQTRLLVNNPRVVTEADALQIYREAY